MAHVAVVDCFLSPMNMQQLLQHTRKLKRQQICKQEQLLKFRKKFSKVSAEIEEQVSRLDSPKERILNHQRKMLHQVSIATAETSLWRSDEESNSEEHSHRCRAKGVRTRVDHCIRKVIMHNMNSSSSESGMEVSITAADDRTEEHSRADHVNSWNSTELSSINYSPPLRLPRIQAMRADGPGERSISNMSGISTSSLEAMRRTMQRHAQPTSPGLQPNTPSRICGSQQNTPTRRERHDSATTPLRHDSAAPQTSTPTTLLRSPGTPLSTPSKLTRRKRGFSPAYFSSPCQLMSNVNDTIKASNGEATSTPKMDFPRKRLRPSDYFLSPQPRKLQMKPSPLCTNTNLSYFVGSELQNENKEVPQDHQDSSEEETDQPPARTTITQSQRNIRASRPIHNVRPKRASTGSLMNSTYVIPNKAPPRLPSIPAIREIQGSSNTEFSSESEDMTLIDLLSRPDCEGKDSTLWHPFIPAVRDDVTCLPDPLSCTTSDAASFMQRPMYNRAITAGHKLERRNTIAKKLRRVGRKIRNGGQDFMTLAVL